MILLIPIDYSKLLFESIMTDRSTRMFKKMSHQRCSLLKAKFLVAFLTEWSILSALHYHPRFGLRHSTEEMRSIL